MTHVNVALIGYAFMGKAHSNAYRQVGPFFKPRLTPRLKVICGRTRAKVEDAARDYGWEEAATDWEEVVARKDIDIVDVSTPGDMHAPIAIAAAKAGKAVLCEKPLAPTLAEGRQVLREIGDTGEALLSLGFMRRFDPGYAALRQAIDDGSIGAPVLVHNVSRGVSSAPNATSEFSITGSAIHECDVVPWLLRSPVVEVSWVAPRRSAQAVEGLQDPQLIHLRTADGVLSTVETFLNARYGYVMRCEVVGENGTVSLTEPARVVVEGDLKRSLGYAADWRPRFADAYRLELQAWVDSVLAGAPTPLATGRDGVAASAVAEAVIASMHDGGRATKVETS
jgi:myo-inositol 2-dehydrogenase/D-chiro-inositol 1-dehydrogenase